jgi:hypothetical protein
MGDTEPFRVLSTAEYQLLSIEQKLHYLELAFRHSCASDLATPILSPDAAEQSESAESKI